MPTAVIAEARRYLEHLESERDRERVAAADQNAAGQVELPLFGAETASDALRDALAGLDPDELTPKAALEALYELRRLLTNPAPTKKGPFREK